MDMQRTELTLPVDVEDLDFPDDQILGWKDKVAGALVREMTREKLQACDRETMHAILDDAIDTLLKHEEPVSAERRAILFEEIWDEVVGLGPLQYFLDEPSVSQVVVRAPTDIIVERNGVWCQSPRRFRHNAHFMEVIARILEQTGRELTDQAPTMEGHLTDGSTVNIASAPLVDGPCLSIRKKPPEAFVADALDSLKAGLNAAANQA